MSDSRLLLLTPGAPLLHNTHFIGGNEVWRLLRFLTDLNGVDSHQECDDEHHWHDKELDRIESFDEFAHMQQGEQRHEAGQHGVDDLGGLTTI